MVQKYTEKRSLLWPPFEWECLFYFYSIRKIVCLNAKSSLNFISFLSSWYSPSCTDMPLRQYYEQQDISPERKMLDSLMKMKEWMCRLHKPLVSNLKCRDNSQSVSQQQVSSSHNWNAIFLKEHSTFQQGGKYSLIQRWHRWGELKSYQDAHMTKQPRLPLQPLITSISQRRKMNPMPTTAH